MSKQLLRLRSHSTSPMSSSPSHQVRYYPLHLFLFIISFKSFILSITIASSINCCAADSRHRCTSPVTFCIPQLLHAILSLARVLALFPLLVALYVPRVIYLPADGFHVQVDESAPLISQDPSFVPQGSLLLQPEDHDPDHDGPSTGKYGTFTSRSGPTTRCASPVPGVREPKKVSTTLLPTRPSNSSPDKHTRGCSRSLLARALHTCIPSYATSLAFQIPKVAVHCSMYPSFNTFPLLMTSRS